MIRITAIPLLLVVVACPAFTQPPPLPPGERGWIPRGEPVADVGGRWYMHGDPRLPCEVRQPRLDGRALFINENGDAAWGTVEANRVFIPDWSDGWSQGLVGRVRGDRIIWPDGNYWSRRYR